MKLFNDMTKAEKIEHISQLHEELKAVLESEGIVLADIVDWYDYWIPWLLKEVRSC